MILIEDYAAVEEACERCIDCERCTFACENLRESRISLNGIACCMRAAQGVDDEEIQKRILADEVIVNAVGKCTLCGACVMDCPCDVDVTRLILAARSAYASKGIALR